MKPQQIVTDDPTTLIAQSVPASEQTTNLVLFAPQSDEGRSEFKWLLLANGDLALALYPRGELYARIRGVLAAEGCPLIGGL